MVELAEDRENKLDDIIAARAVLWLCERTSVDLETGFVLARLRVSLVLEPLGIDEFDVGGGSLEEIPRLPLRI
jgi:hypothetical protein